MPANKAHVFRARLIGHGAELRKKAVVLVNGVTFTLYAHIVGAPEHKVDTGRARAGWAISVAVPGTFVPPVRKRPSSGRGSVSAPLFTAPGSRQFIATITAAPLEAKRIIYNNVEYIVWIELGTETSEGSHVVRLAIQRLLAA